MKNDPKIKSLTPFCCPVCNTELLISQEITPPLISGIVTPQDLIKSKIDLLAKVKLLGLKKDELKEVEEWINEETTKFLPNEVEELLGNIKEQYQIK